MEWSDASNSRSTSSALPRPRARRPGVLQVGPDLLPNVGRERRLQIFERGAAQVGVLGEEAAIREPERRARERQREKREDVLQAPVRPRPERFVLQRTPRLVVEAIEEPLTLPDAPLGPHFAPHRLEDVLRRNAEPGMGREEVVERPAAAITDLEAAIGEAGEQSLDGRRVGNHAEHERHAAADREVALRVDEGRDEMIERRVGDRP